MVGVNQVGGGASEMPLHVIASSQFADSLPATKVKGYIAFNPLQLIRMH